MELEELKAKIISDLDNKKVVDSDDIIEYLARTNTKEYNAGKVNEELFEIGEVFNKFRNKAPDYRPDPKLIFEEFGDLIFRLAIWATQEFGSDAADQYIDESRVHIEEKAAKFAGHIKSGKYKGGV